MFSRFFIERPIFAAVVAILVALAGAVAMLVLPVQQYPSITPVQVTVSATYPGADAKTLADSVASPIEQQVNGVDNMLYMVSSSSSTGQLTLTVYFAIDTDPDIAQVQVQNRVNLAMPQLPSAVAQQGVQVHGLAGPIDAAVGIEIAVDRALRRAARNAEGRVILYADRITDSMKKAMDETSRRRKIQSDYNKEHGITPATVTKAILDLSPTSGARDYYAVPKNTSASPSKGSAATASVDLADRIEALRQEMFLAAESLEFEKAARLRDQIRILKGELDGEGAGESAKAEPARAAKGATKGAAGGRSRKSCSRGAPGNGRGRYR